MKIGEMASRVGCSIQTIRYYEREGLLPTARRSSGNFRLYGQEELAILTFIKHCRALDIPLGDIKVLLQLKASPNSSCDSINTMIARHLEKVRQKVEELHALEASLVEMANSCQDDRTITDCGILHSLERNQER